MKLKSYLSYTHFLSFRRAVIATISVLSVSVALAAKDPLPSWNDTAPKQEIIKYVQRITDEDSLDFIPPANRVATLDNDGTLWGEKPIIEIAFVNEHVKQLASTNKDIAALPEVKALLAKDMEYFKEHGEKAEIGLLLVSHTNQSLNDFQKSVRSFIDNYKDPKTGRTIKENRYQPMLELLDYLRANQFDIWICTGGTENFVRVFSQELYGVAPDHVIGTQFKTEERNVDGKAVTWILPKITHINDKEGKPVGIKQVLGDKRPIIAGGNEGGEGDIAMLKYSKEQKDLTFQIIINHNDAGREARYTEPKDQSLMASLRYGFMVVSMVDDWKTVFFTEEGKPVASQAKEAECPVASGN